MSEEEKGRETSGQLTRTHRGATSLTRLGIGCNLGYYVFSPSSFGFISTPPARFRRPSPARSREKRLLSAMSSFPLLCDVAQYPLIVLHVARCWQAMSASKWSRRRKHILLEFCFRRMPHVHRHVPARCTSTA